MFRNLNRQNVGEGFSSFSFLLSYCCSSAIRAMSHFIPELASSAVRISFRSLLSTMGIENRGMTMWYLGGIFIQSYSSSQKHFFFVDFSTYASKLCLFAWLFHIVTFFLLHHLFCCFLPRTPPICIFLHQIALIFTICSPLVYFVTAEFSNCQITFILWLDVFKDSDCQTRTTCFW